MPACRGLAQVQGAGPMALQIISTTPAGPTQINLGGADDVLIAEGVTVANDLAVVLATGSYQSATILGTLSSETSTAVSFSVGSPAEVSYARITVGATGAVFGNTYGIAVTGYTVRVINDGLVRGDYYGVMLAADSEYSRSRLDNTGRISGLTAVYYVGTQDLELTNSGILDGRSFAFYSDAGTSEDSLTNHGTMMGKVVTGAGADLMRNWSRIEGDLMMGGGNDSVYNYGQIHAVDLGEGDDLYFASGAEATAYVVDGGAGADSFVPGAAAEEIYGGDGRDQISFTAATIGVVVDLTLPLANGGAAAGDRYFEIENVFGSRYADRIRGSFQANRLVAGDGADSLIGLGGGDVLNGEAGHDAIDGGDGNDTLNGGAGNDQLVGAEGADALRGQDGADTMSGGAGIDRLTGGTGNDAFVFARPVEGGDVITDFGIAAGNNDLFLIDASVFGFGAASGELAAGQFRTRGVNEAVDADDRFIFRTTDRTLWFDRDGSGEVAPLLVADLQAGAVVTAEDILLV